MYQYSLNKKNSAREQQTFCFVLFVENSEQASGKTKSQPFLFFHPIHTLTDSHSYTLMH